MAFFCVLIQNQEILFYKKIKSSPKNFFSKKFYPPYAMALLPLNYIWINIIGFVRPVKQGSWVRLVGFYKHILPTKFCTKFI